MRLDVYINIAVLSITIRVYLHEYILTVANILKLHPMKFPAPPSEILQKERIHIDTFIGYLTECLDVEICK
jgi:hypothetical protein